jgi:hypothetical protein
MISDDTVKQLHDRFTRGEPLSAEEQARLEEWYAEQDTAENHILGLPTNPNTTNITAIKAQVDMEPCIP